MGRKLHTLRKRKYGLSTHLRHKRFFKPTGGKSGARTFSTEDAAKKWASEHGLKQYTIVKAKKNKRFKIIQAK